MTIIRTALVVAALAAIAGPAAAFSPLTPSDSGSGYGDTKLSYQNGVVYDDDLVPGRGANQSFQLGDNVNTRTSVQNYGTNRNIRPDSPNLIGRDGRILLDR